MKPHNRKIVANGVCLVILGVLTAALLVTLAVKTQEFLFQFPSVHPTIEVKVLESLR